MALTAEEKVQIITEAAKDKKAEDVVVLDVRGKTLMADYFVICSGNSKVHIRAITDAILEKLKAAGVKEKRIEGYGPGGWILLDFGDVIAHIMMQEEREFYNLEELWRGAASEVETLRTGSS